MSYVSGTSCFLHSPFCPLPCSSHSRPINACNTRLFRTPMSIASSSMSQQRQDPNDDVGSVIFCNKRRVLLMGIYVLPLLGLKVKALEELATTKESEVKTQEKDRKAETATNENDRQSNLFVSLLNIIGIYCSGTLGALYALARKEKTTALATIETVSSKLKEKEELIGSLKRNYESELLNEREERSKKLGKAKEEQRALVNELSSANNIVSRLEQEVKGGKKLIEELKLQISTLESKVSKTDADKKEFEKNLKGKVDSIETLQERINQLNLDLKDKEDRVRNLSSLIEEKELGLRNLTSTNNQTKDDLSNARLQIQGLKDELLKSREELEAKDSLVNELNSRISSVTLEKDDSKNKYDAIEKEYNDLRFTSEKKVTSDTYLLREKEDEIYRLKDQLEYALSEAKRNRVIIADLTQERENLKESLENESKKDNDLKNELQIAQENLGKSRDEAAVLEEQLNESSKLQKELEFEVSKLSSRLNEVRELLKKSLDDAKHEAEMLTSELTTTKEQLKKTQEELRSVSDELKAAIESRDSLQTEVNGIYRMAETAAEDLEEEKKLVDSLNKDLCDLEKQFSEYKEARKSHEKHLKEATKSLEEMNRNAAILSTQLENAESLISSLENEKDALNKSLSEQRNATKEAQENIEYAQNIIKKLGDERESLQNRGKKLVEELSVAKGEILRLRSQINSSKVSVNNVQVHKDEGESKVPKNKGVVNNVQVQKDEVENESKVTINTPKTSRRRKANNQ
ncbi:PREDICTED: MAR-binding filament-like protein 1 isoform X3 [Lupinus angustifolius]|uniref:MAR-binding filament-like protein 1 isoform X3 n=1 Tax=Lupinus angustifolius TaxID=3871 RepID=UPI00092EDC34|nr:PREDICTED: MAR-binding filament-like protein 1 isoform X3 [Lupinus angustifolius]